MNRDQPERESRADRDRRLTVAGATVGGCCLLILTNGPVFTYARRVLDRSAGFEDPFVRPFFVAVAWIAVVLLGGHLLAEHRNGRKLRQIVSVPALLVVGFAVLGVLSSRWSTLPDLTLQRSLVYLGLAALSWWFGTRRFELVLSSVATMAAAGVIASLVVVWTHPAIGESIDGSWRGVYTGRNSLAPICVMALIAGATVAARWRTAVARVIGGVLVIVGVVGLLGTGNETAPLGLGLGVLAAVSIVGVGAVHRRYGSGAGIGMAGVTALAYAATLLAVWSLVSQTSTLRTRRLIWQLTWNSIRDRPWQGYGFFGFWEDPVLTRYAYLRIGSAFGSAHNSGLEVLLDLGVIGFVPFVAIVGLALFGPSRRLWRGQDVESCFWVVLVVFLVVENMTESFVLWYSYNWVLLGAAAIRFAHDPDPVSSR